MPQSSMPDPAAPESSMPRSDATKSDVAKFGSFVVTGGIAALANLLSRYLLSSFMRYELSVFFAYIVGLNIAFVLARRFVFDASGRSWIGEYRRFALVNVASFIQVWTVSIVLARWGLPALGVTSYVEEIAHLVGVASPIVTSFYAHKNYSFQEAKAPVLRDQP